MNLIYNHIHSILILMIFSPIIGSALILFLRVSNDLSKKIALNSSLFSFVLSVILFINFNKTDPQFQFISSHLWGLNFQRHEILLGVDGISLYFILLTTLIFPICFLASWNIKNFIKEYFIAFLVMESLLLLVFSILDLVWFYIFFESILMPMFIIIGFWGSRDRKIRAAYRLFFYTLIGSVLMLLAILIIYFETGTTNYILLVTFQFSEQYQKLFWLAFFASFAAKVPMLPFHIWLPEAHVEAPTAGSVVLAGILLKLGTYGFLRFSMPLFPFANIYFTPLIFTMAVIAIIFTSLTAMRQTDLKRIIAYASVAHMNLTLIGLFSLQFQGVEGSILQMLSHGLVASALFLCIGIIYERHHTRLINYYSGLAFMMPVFVIVLLFFTMANIALPGTSSFVGEFLIFVGAFQISTIITFFSATGLVLGGTYSLWLFNRLSYGSLKRNSFEIYSDVNWREFFYILPLTIGTLIMGIYPEFFLSCLHVSVSNLITYGSDIYMVTPLVFFVPNVELRWATSKYFLSLEKRVLKCLNTLGPRESSFNSFVLKHKTTYSFDDKTLEKFEAIEARQRGLRNYSGRVYSDFYSSPLKGFPEKYEIFKKEKRSLFALYNSISLLKVQVNLAFAGKKILIKENLTPLEKIIIGKLNLTAAEKLIITEKNLSDDETLIKQEKIVLTAVERSEKENKQRKKKLPKMATIGYIKDDNMVEIKRIKKKRKKKSL